MKKSGSYGPLFLLVRRACSMAWRCESSSQPDRGEVIAKRKGVAARRGLKEAWSKNASQCTRTGSEARASGERANDREAHIYQGRKA